MHPPSPSAPASHPLSPLHLSCCAPVRLSAQSGIAPTAETLANVDELRKNASKYFFATFKVEGVNIVPDQVWGEPSLKSQGDAAVAAAFEKSIWPEFVKALVNADGPRFAVIDFIYQTKYEHTGHRKRKKEKRCSSLASILWRIVVHDRAFGVRRLFSQLLFVVFFLLVCVCFS